VQALRCKGGAGVSVQPFRSVRCAGGVQSFWSMREFSGEAWELWRLHSVRSMLGDDAFQSVRALLAFVLSRVYAVG
jgi:hypothetical protein